MLVLPLCAQHPLTQLTKKSLRSLCMYRPDVHLLKKDNHYIMHPDIRTIQNDDFSVPNGKKWDHWLFFLLLLWDLVSFNFTVIYFWLFLMWYLGQKSYWAYKKVLSHTHWSFMETSGTSVARLAYIANTLKLCTLGTANKCWWSSYNASDRLVWLLCDAYATSQPSSPEFIIMVIVKMALCYMYRSLFFM